MSVFSDGAAAADGAIDVIKSVNDWLIGAGNYTGQQSLVTASRHARVEPLLIIDAAAANLQDIDAVAQSMQSLFAGYYLQAIDMIANIDGVAVRERLAPLNPNRKLDLDLLSHRFSAESYKFMLPKKDNIKRIALEDSVQVADSKAAKYTQELTSLSTGKMYDVTICSNEKKATIKVGIRVMAKSMPTNSLVEMCAHKSIVDHDLVERFHGWRSGRLGFIRDLILCQDLIAKHRNASIKDKSGVYDEIITRKNNAVTAGLLERNPSLAVFSNLCIMSSDTMSQIEAKMSAPITNAKMRNTLFDTTNMMILAVVDPGYDMVTFYTHGIAQGSEISMRALKNSTKGNGPDPIDLMRSFLQGRTPAL